VTPQLKNEGVARDIIRNVQSLRKDAGLEIADRITLSLVSNSPSVKAAIDQCQDYIAGETLAVEVVTAPLSAHLKATTVELDGPGEVVSLALRKA